MITILVHANIQILYFSFHPLKNITSFEGGIITTNNLSYKKRIVKLREHGIVRFKDKNKGLNWKYKISSIDIISECQKFMLH